MKEFRKYQSHKNEIITKTFLGVLIVCYIFFFTSNFTIPKPISKDVCKFETAYEYGNKRVAEFISATYSKEQMELELVFRLTNNSHDGLNDYLYDLGFLGKRAKNIVQEEVLNDTMLTVVKFYNVKNFREAYFYLAPDFKDRDVEKEDIVSFTFNENNLTYGEIDNDKAPKDYLTERIQRIIEEKNQQLNEILSDTKNARKQIQNITEENENLENSKKYMTYSESQTADEQIETNNTVIAGLKEDLESYEKSREEISAEITEANDRLAEINGDLEN